MPRRDPCPDCGHHTYRLRSVRTDTSGTRKPLAEAMRCENPKCRKIHALIP